MAPIPNPIPNPNNWRKAKASNPYGNCVEVQWMKSSLSYSNSNCVEVAQLPSTTIGVRDSKDPEGPVLMFTPDEWHAFLGGVRNGEFDDFI